MITYFDLVDLDDNMVFVVTRIHDDGIKSTKRCHISELKGQDPEDYLDRILSQHLSGTGQQRGKSKETTRLYKEKQVNSEQKDISGQVSKSNE